MAMCSTPVGVKDRFTQTVFPCEFVLSRAQRLSASKIGSLERQSRRWRNCRVLNACRRQRSVHYPFRRQQSTRRQVLNACRRQRSVHSCTRHIRSARGHVLNACRRQRSVHCRASCCMCRTGVCAQRLSASKIGSQKTQDISVSQSVVLNACRRQRSVHLLRSPRPRSVCRAQRLSASKIGSRRDRPGRDGGSFGAQRLSASKIGSHLASLTELKSRTVLNACRRQRSVHEYL